MIMKNSKKSKEQKVVEQIINHGMKAQAFVDDTWCDIPLAQFPHTNKIGERKDDKYDIEFYAVPENTYVNAYDPKTGAIKKAAVHSWSIHRGKEVEIVTLDNGKQLLTDDDPRAVYGIAKNATSLDPQRFTPDEALKQEVFVPVVHGTGAPRFSEDLCTGDLDAWDAEEDMKLAEASVYKHNSLIDCYYNFNTGELIRECDLADIAQEHIITKLDFAFGQFLGCMAGDGWWDKKDYSSFYTLGKATRALHLSDLAEHNAKFVMDWLTSTIGHVEYRQKKQYAAFDSSRYGDAITHTYFSEKTAILAEALSHLLKGHADEESTGAKNKVLPAWASYAPEDFRYGLVCGLISTDGSISQHTHEDGRVQLIVNFTSTSLTLVKSMSSLLNSLSIPSRIGVSQETIAGNISWALTVSTPEFKRAEKNMLGMANKDKLTKLLQSYVAVDGKFNKPTVRIIFPRCVSDVVARNMACPKITKLMRERRNAQDLEKIDQTNFAISLYASAKDGYVTLKTAVKLYRYAWQQYMDILGQQGWLKTALLITGALESDPDTTVPYDTDLNTGIKHALDTIIPLHYRTDYEKETIDKLKKVMNRYANKGKAKASLIQSLYELFLYGKSLLQDNKRCLSLFQEPMFQDWVVLLTGGFTWSKVESVEKTGKVETGYDLTVPGYETFMNAEGVILSNTINVHVPASDDAVKEAYEKLMPSRTPFSDRVPDKIVPLPKQEQVLGLYTAATAPSTTPVVFDTEEQAVNAIRRGEVPLSADVQIRSGVKMASVEKNLAEIMPKEEKGPERNPSSGKFMPTSRDNTQEIKVEKSEK